MNESFKINVNKHNANEKIIMLVKVVHPTLSSSIRLVQDNQKIIFEDEEYIPFPMSIKMENQIEGELPKATITIPNVAKQIVKWVDVTMGASGASIDVVLTRRSTLSRDYEVTFDIEGVVITSESITFSMSVQNNLVKPAIRWRYDTSHAIGLF